MLTGALAASYYGRPRTTLDLDVVVAFRENDMPILAKALISAGLNVQEQRLRAAWMSEYRMATVEDARSPHTLDIVLTQENLQRYRGRILGVPTYYQGPESLILAKLRMIKVTLQAERAVTDREDIKAILEITPVNLEALRKSAREQSTAGILDELLHAKLRQGK